MLQRLLAERDPNGGDRPAILRMPSASQSPERSIVGEDTPVAERRNQRIGNYRSEEFTG